MFQDLVINIVAVTQNKHQLQYILQVSKDNDFRVSMGIWSTKKISERVNLTYPNIL